MEFYRGKIFLGFYDLESTKIKKLRFFAQKILKFNGIKQK